MMEKGAVQRLFHASPKRRRTASPAERDAVFSISAAAGLALVCLNSTGPLDATGAGNLEIGRGRPARIVLSHPMPKMVRLLPGPGEFAA